MKSFKQIFYTLNESENDDIIQMFKDHIDTAYDKRNYEKVKSLKNRLMDRFGIDYDPKTATSDDATKIANVSIDDDDLYNKNDFKNFNNYKKYSEVLFTKKFKEYSKLLRNKHDHYVSVHNFAKTMGVPYQIGNFNATWFMRVDSGTDRIIINTRNEKIGPNDTAPLSVLIHEYGHVVEHMLGFDRKFDQFESYQYHNASSNYNLSPSEIWAENFKHFFIEPLYLKTGWLNVYKEIDRIVPSKYKNKIKKALVLKK